MVRCIGLSEMSSSFQAAQSCQWPFKTVIVVLLLELYTVFGPFLYTGVAIVVVGCLLFISSFQAACSCERPPITLIGVLLQELISLSGLFLTLVWHIFGVGCLLSIILFRMHAAVSGLLCLQLLSCCWSLPLLTIFPGFFFSV